MDNMKQKAFSRIGICLAALALLVPAAAAVNPIDLNGEDLYCTRYGISFFCDPEGAEFLANLTPEDLEYYKYINDFAFSDAVRYTGQLRITSITVDSNLTDSSRVEAVYKIKNPSSDEVSVEIAALESPVDTKTYLNGELLDVDPLLDGVKTAFSPGEEKELKLIFAEPLYGSIYGYNINLLFDNKTTDNQITNTGKFTFTLPRGAAITQCVPTGYTTKTEGGRTVVTWSKRDFVAWTNPFTDLICKWNTTAGAGATAGDEPKAASGDNTLLILLLVIILLAGAFAAYKKGMLDGVLNR